MGFLNSTLQTLLAMVQALAIVAGLALAGLCLPFYCLFTGAHMSTGMWVFTGLIVMFLVCFFMAPWYTVIWGTISAIAFGILLIVYKAFETYMSSDRGMFETLPLVLFGFFSIGIFWGIVRRIAFRHAKPASH